jgi:nucleotide-binding universal stress UspA family protein
MTIRRILCAIDFSTPSRVAMRDAGDLAKRFNATLELLYVYHSPTLHVPGHTTPVEILNDTDDRLVEIGAHLAAWRDEAISLCETTVSTQSRQGVPWDEIVSHASEGDFDLIVMATRGNTGLKRLVLGSVAERVVRHATCRVLTVHAPIDA